MDYPKNIDLNKFFHEKTSNICKHCCYFRNGMSFLLDFYNDGEKNIIYENDITVKTSTTDNIKEKIKNSKKNRKGKK